MTYTILSHTLSEMYRHQHIRHNYMLIIIHPLYTDIEASTTAHRADTSPPPRWLT